MKNTLKLSWIIALLLIISFSACIIEKKDDPKELALLSFDLYKETMDAIFNFSKIAEIDMKSKELEERVEKLSDADKKIYEAELNRLSMETLGSLFVGFGNMLKSLSESSLNFGGNYDYSIDDTLNILDATGKILDSTRHLLDSALNFANSFND